LIEALASQTKRAPLVVQGDFHATGVGKMHRSGELTLERGVDVVTSGTLGTGDLVFPSAFRSVESKPSQLVGMDETLKMTEKNGFTVMDITPDKIVFSMFLWRPPQRIEEIDTMQPALVYEVPRKS
jgi:hypothetical protein